jgi:hypothetical protein
MPGSPTSWHQLPARLDLVFAPGDDLILPVLLQVNGAAFNLIGSTIEATVRSSTSDAVLEVLTIVPTNLAGGSFSVSVSTLLTTLYARRRERWTLKVVDTSGYDRTWVAGDWHSSPSSERSRTSGGTATINLTSAGQLVLNLTGGAQGPAGPGLGAFVHTQTVPATVWTINHNFGFRPNCQLWSLAWTGLEASREHLSENTLRITHLTPQTGYARLT